MAKPLTERQQAILDFISAEISEKSRAPTIMEIAEAFSINNPNGVRTHLVALERKGYITRESDKSRSIRLQVQPNRLARWITEAKQHHWEHSNCFAHLPVYIVLRTRKGYSFFEGRYGAQLERKLRKLAANHDWEILELEVTPTGLTMGLVISPDHSIDRVVRNLKHTATTMGLKHPIHFRGKRIWATGYAATSDRSLLADLAAQFVAHTEKAGTTPKEKGQS